ncbi:MAG: type I-C CRISPR-associated protein Cas8c/Csd1 [Acidobacteriia bacterium]|nr:type I-C CRISPR-associated protein Cas8c/Csd1 [Terriglobia bacterium]
MGWMQKLYETYERCNGAPQFKAKPLNPVSSLYQHTQIQVTIDADGNFRRAAQLELQDTVIPVSEESATRSGKNPEPNPLTDKLAYCAADIGDFGGNGQRYEGYERQLRQWCNSEFSDPKASAVLRYLEKKMLIGDLIREGVLKCENGKLSSLKIPGRMAVEAKDAWVRWRVELAGDPAANTWEDEGLFRKWASFEGSLNRANGTCAVTGENVRIARLHPRAIRSNSDGAKLVTSNDDSGFTYRGRFGNPDQAVTVGYEVTQKAHNALRWLIKRRGYRAGDQIFVAWAVGGGDVPDPCWDTGRLFGAPGDVHIQPDDQYGGDAGQLYALRLKKAIAGYRANLSDFDEVVVMGLDSATPGRMAITYYRELTGSEFLDRITSWHDRCAWFQKYSKDNRFMGAPAPNEIAEAAYGKRIGKKQELRKATVERLLPCIVDGRPLPRDLVEVAMRRASNRAGFEKSKSKQEWEWEKCLGIACALVRGSSEENYRMSLEKDRTTRDYLYGRLLAIAENIEDRALYVAKETRDTTAAKLMQRFASHPYSTWRNIEIALGPYRTRLRANRPAILLEREKLLDAVQCMFRPEDFTNDTKLSGEFLLGYHCQRAALWAKANKDNKEESVDETATEGEME